MRIFWKELYLFKDAFGLLKVRPILKYNFLKYYILMFWERKDSHSWGAKISENPFDTNYGSQWSKSPPNLLLSLKSLKAHCSSWVYPLEKFLHICTEDMYQNVHFSIISGSKNYKCLKYSINEKMDKLHIFIYVMNYSYIHQHGWILKLKKRIAEW